MNPVLILTHNCLELTKRCVESVKRQDVPTSIFVLDNGSTDGTFEWLKSGEHGILWDVADHNAGVSRGWNEGLSRWFFGWIAGPPADHVLVLNNDTVLPPWFYSELLSYDVPFVTGVSVDLMDNIRHRPTHERMVPHPDFSAFLIRKEAWEKIGEFDEAMKHYASDCDYHVRGHRLGVPMMKALVPYYHERSSTIRLASPQEKFEISRQADLDRAAFGDKWGCIPGTPEYAELFR